MKRKGELFKKVGILISVVLTVFWLIPYIYVICCSFKPGAESDRGTAEILPGDVFCRKFSRVCLSGWMHCSFL
mgnify:CR=1 FL=1